jgi:dinuclear metal center YbgI/SA1388 family protein
VASRDEIVAFLDDHLDAGGYPDALPVGLQVTGAAEVAKVVSAVSASLELFRRATQAEAQMLVVHHGLFWDRDPRRIGPRERERLRALFDGDLSLLAYHLCLDAHPTLGNNAILCERLGLGDLQPFAEHRGRTIAFIGNAQPPLRLDELVGRVRSEVNPDALVMAEGPERIGRVAVVSGSAAGDLDAAADAGADAFVTGEPSEPALHRHVRPGCTSSRPATTPRRCSACRRSVSCWSAGLASSTSSSICRIRCSGSHRRGPARAVSRLAGKIAASGIRLRANG